MAYRTKGASKAVPGFDVIDYGQEDYVFGDSDTDARHATGASGYCRRCRKIRKRSRRYSRNKYNNEAPGRFTIPGAVIYQLLSRFTQHREPWAFPSNMAPDWINPKYSAGDLLWNAILDVQYRPTESAAPEQIGMEI